MPEVKIRLKYWRLRKAITLTELAQKTGLNIATLSFIEHGRIPEVTTIRKIANALGIKPEELVVDADEEDDRLVKVS